jgi:hypothetical protein
MSRLPLKGDALLATHVLNGRMGALGASESDEFITTGPVVFTESGLTGMGVESLRAAYGDLFDLEETLNEAGFGKLVTKHEQEIDAGSESVGTALVALLLQAVAHGVLQERLRWEASL